MEFDPALFADASVQGIPLMVVVFGLVELLKSLGVSGNSLRIASAIAGLILGVAYQIATVPAALSGFSSIFAVVVYGLALGIFTSVTYDGLVKIAGKAPLR